MTSDDARQLPQRDYLRLKAALRDLVGAAGGVERGARLTRGNASMLSRYGAPQEAMQAPIDVIADLEAEAGAPIVTRVLADLMGFDLVPKEAAAADPAVLTRHLAETTAAHAGLAGEIANALADGTIDDAEAARIDAAAQSGERELAELRRDLAGRRAKGRDKSGGATRLKAIDGGGAP